MKLRDYQKLLKAKFLQRLSPPFLEKRKKNSQESIIMRKTIHQLEIKEGSLKREHKKAIKNSPLFVLPWVWTGNAGVGSASSALQRVTPINNSFASYREVSKSVVFFFHSGIWHRRHPVKWRKFMINGLNLKFVFCRGKSQTSIVAAVNTVDWVARKLSSPVFWLIVIWCGVVNRICENKILPLSTKFHSKAFWVVNWLD